MALSLSLSPPLQNPHLCGLQRERVLDLSSAYWGRVTNTGTPSSEWSRKHPTLSPVKFQVTVLSHSMSKINTLQIFSHAFHFIFYKYQQSSNSQFSFFLHTPAWLVPQTDDSTVSLINQTSELMESGVLCWMAGYVCKLSLYPDPDLWLCDLGMFVSWALRQASYLFVPWIIYLNKGKGKHFTFEIHPMDWLSQELNTRLFKNKARWFIV